MNRNIFIDEKNRSGLTSSYDASQATKSFGSNLEYKISTPFFDNNFVGINSSLKYNPRDIVYKTTKEVDVGEIPQSNSKRNSCSNLGSGDKVKLNNLVNAQSTKSYILPGSVFNTYTPTSHVAELMKFPSIPYHQMRTMLTEHSLVTPIIVAKRYTGESTPIQPSNITSSAISYNRTISTSINAPSMNIKPSVQAASVKPVISSPTVTNKNPILKVDDQNVQKQQIDPNSKYKFQPNTFSQRTSSNPSTPNLIPQVSRSNSQQKSDSKNTTKVAQNSPVLSSTNSTTPQNYLVAPTGKAHIGNKLKLNVDIDSGNISFDSNQTLFPGYIKSNIQDIKINFKKDLALENMKLMSDWTMIELPQLYRDMKYIDLTTKKKIKSESTNKVK